MDLLNQAFAFSSIKQCIPIVPIIVAKQQVTALQSHRSKDFTTVVELSLAYHRSK